MKLIITERQIKKLLGNIIEQNDMVRAAINAASGPQKCGATQKDFNATAKEVKREIKNAEKENAQAAKETAENIKRDWDDFVNPYLDAYGDKLDKNSKQEFNDNYKTFISQNTDFKLNSRSLGMIPSYSIINKLSARSGLNYSLMNRIKEMGKFSGNISENEMYNFIKKLGGFDKFKIWYQSGWPLKVINEGHDDKPVKDNTAKFITCKGCRKKFTQTLHKGKKSLPICPNCGTHNNEHK